ncbi:MAG TPA: hypothetical protein VFN48_00985 [Solirubrobacteraceae bacterium]|nr:hypothetical protein [Solirubrobacteraceae bacterium]
MSSTEPAQKINLGFHGGQVLTARVKSADLAALRGALGNQGFYELKADTGTIVLDLTRVDYLLIDDEQHKVGF